MPRKKSIRRSAGTFCDKSDALVDYVSAAEENLSDAHITWCYEYAIIRLYREFEILMLEAITGAINNDTTTISRTTGIDFPDHLTDELCEYLITGSGYFDFKGRDGLIKLLKQYVPSDHYLVTIIKRNRYKDSLEHLSALRNYAAHDSYQSKNTAKKVTGFNRMAACGAWLKKQGRFTWIIEELKELSGEIYYNAPY
ncbi:hypothetical protein [Thioalkalivibrio sp. ALMg11]|uniref:hypothetical protein n=1 Tax=Thioalkalivibrio sp. ALMg11 TaxID=1158165 RepID=UPI000376EE85|nr:hypothetical protein [Thioalkalivibrio sp. ALMg11]